jgi:thymidylate synthase (FAD)
METYRETTQTAESILHEDRPMESGGTIGLVDYLGGDASIAAAATLGHGPRIAGVTSVDDLLVSLAHNDIWRPFQFAEVKLRFALDLAGAQHLVYRPEASINQFSGRYSEFVAGSSDLRFFGGSDELEAAHTHAATQVFEVYRELLAESLAKETARGVMLDTTNTSFFYKANLAQLFQTVEDLRRTSWKHNRERIMLAEELLDAARAVAPIAVEAYEAKQSDWTADHIDWEIVARNAPKAVMSEAEYPERNVSETRRAIVPELEALIRTSFEPIRGGLVRVTDYMGDLHAIADAARVSYASGSKASKDAALVRTLLSDRHTTPFEMAELAFDVRMPLYIMRQSGRHRTLDQAWFMGELAVSSERYVPVNEDLAPQSKTDHQGRGGAFEREAQERIKERLAHADSVLESVRTDDPGLRDRLRPVDSWTRFSMKGDPHNLLHYVRLREDSHAQLEIARYGAVFADVMRAHVPVVMDAFDRFERQAVRFDRDEIAAIKDAGLDNGIDAVIERAVEAGVFGVKPSARREAKIEAFRKRLETLY